jgi:predicted RNA-binding Zn-ribbon protein involved in translation (DUF1610 family)
MTKEYPQHDEYEPGTWKGLKTPGDRSASFTCPVCGQTAVLTDHAINEAGDVWPSVVCPGINCGFHEYVTLIGWTP